MNKNDDDRLVGWTIPNFSQNVKNIFKSLVYKNGMTIKGGLEYLIYKWLREEKAVEEKEHNEKGPDSII